MRPTDTLGSQMLPHIQDAWRVMGLSMPVVAWIDDLAIPVVTTTANTLVETVQEILEEVVRIGKTFGPHPQHACQEDGSGDCL